MEIVIDNKNLQISPKRLEIITKFKNYVEVRVTGFFS